MTMEVEVVSVGHLVGGCLSMKDVIDVRIHEASLQSAEQVGCYRSQEFCKTLGAVARPKGRTFH